MSLESFIAGKALDQASGDSLSFSLSRLENTLEKQIEFQQKPFVFLRSNNNNLSSNVNDGILILNGPSVPTGAKGVIEDFNINFTTTAGTIRLVILDASNSIVTDILRDINSSTNGTGKTVLEEGQRLGLVGQTAGNGVLSVYCSGYLQQIRRVN